MRNLKAILVSAAPLLVLAASATWVQAEDAPAGHHHTDVGAFVGSMTFDDVVDSDNGPLFGVRVGYDWSHHWGLELVAGWQQSNLASDATVNRDHAVVAGSLVYSFRFDGDQTVVPFVGGGLGAWQEDTDNAAAQNELILHAVAGLRFRASKHIALMIDVREWFVPFYNPYRGKNVDANNESANFHFAYRF